MLAFVLAVIEKRFSWPEAFSVPFFILLIVLLLFSLCRFLRGLVKSPGLLEKSLFVLVFVVTIVVSLLISLHYFPDGDFVFPLDFLLVMTVFADTLYLADLFYVEAQEYSFRLPPHHLSFFFVVLGAFLFRILTGLTFFLDWLSVLLLIGAFLGLLTSFFCNRRSREPYILFWVAIYFLSGSLSFLISRFVLPLFGL